MSTVGGVRVRLGETGKTPVVDVTVPGSAFKCSGAASQRCRLADPQMWRPLGLDRLNFFLPYPQIQRNNAHVLVRTINLSLPPDIGSDLKLTIDAAGQSYTDNALFVRKANRLSYLHNQSLP
jgi:hypothetical protein